MNARPLDAYRAFMDAQAAATAARKSIIGKTVYAYGERWTVKALTSSGFKIVSDGGSCLIAHPDDVEFLAPVPSHEASGAAA